MGFTEKDADNVYDLVVRRQPTDCGSERDYEDSLYRYLNAAVAGEVFERQYSKAKTRADIYVHFKDGAEVAIEAKYGLTDRGEFHRLIGQMYDYLATWKAEAVVVLCGACDPALAKHVVAVAKMFTDALGKKARVVIKP